METITVMSFLFRRIPAIVRSRPAEMPSSRLIAKAASVLRHGSAQNAVRAVMALSRVPGPLIDGHLLRPDRVTWIAGSTGSSIDLFQRQIIEQALGAGREVIYMRTSSLDNPVVYELGHATAHLSGHGLRGHVSMTEVEAPPEGFEIAPDDPALLVSLGPDREDPDLIEKSRTRLTAALVKALERRRLDGKVLLIEAHPRASGGWDNLLAVLRRIAGSGRDTIVVLWTKEISLPATSALPDEDVILGKSWGPITLRGQVIATQDLPSGRWAAIISGKPALFFETPYEKPGRNPVSSLKYAHVLPVLNARMELSGIPGSHTAALDLMARVSGYSSWMAAAGARINRRS